MALIDKVRRWLLPSLAIAALASCSPPGREPAAPSSALFKPAVAPDLSPPKDADAAGALPSLVVSGEVAAFKATSANATIQENRDAAGSLPSNVAAGKSALYVPRGRAGGIQDGAAQASAPAAAAKGRQVAKP